jgi:hypothetical protein
LTKGKARVNGRAGWKKDRCEDKPSGVGEEGGGKKGLTNPDFYSTFCTERNNRNDRYD